MRILALAMGFLLAALGPGLADTQGLDLAPHAGPAVWQEEHWDINPEKLEAFLAAYDAEVYALARRVAGYRGYTVVTSIPGAEENGPPRSTAYQGVNTKLGGSDHFITGHPGIWLEGRVLTERSINVGAALGRTYNVIVVHHLATWADAERFTAAMAVLYAAEHGGQSLDEHLSQTLYPLANNVWTATYRLVKTGFPMPPAPRRTSALASTPAAHVVIEEHWDVAPETIPAFLDAYEREVYATLRQVKGYRGYSTLTSETLPGDAIPIPLGASAEFYVNRPGMLLDGVVRTDRAINAGAMFRKTFTVKIFHYIDNWTDSDLFVKEFNRIYANNHNGTQPWSRYGWTQSLMPLGRNHWDMYYRVLRLSFQPADVRQH